MHPEVAGITEGLTAVFTLVRFHPHMPHEVQIELGGCDKSPGTHAALEFLLPDMTLTFRSSDSIVRVSIAVASDTVGITVHLSSGMSMARPRRRRGA